MAHSIDRGTAKGHLVARALVSVAVSSLLLSATAHSAPFGGSISSKSAVSRSDKEASESSVVASVFGLVRVALTRATAVTPAPTADKADKNGAPACTAKPATIGEAAAEEEAPTDEPKRRAGVAPLPLFF